MAQSDLNLIYDLWPRRSPPEWTMCRGARLFLFSSSSSPFFLFFFFLSFFFFPPPSPPPITRPLAVHRAAPSKGIANRRQPADVGLPVVRERANRNFIKRGLEFTSRGISLFFFFFFFYKWLRELKFRIKLEIVCVEGEIVKNYILIFIFFVSRDWEIN